jgi:hypothetical protein
MRIPFDAFTQYYCWGSPYFIFWHRSFCLSVIDDGREKCVIDFKNIRCRLFIIIYLLLPCYIRQFVCICVPLCMLFAWARQSKHPLPLLTFSFYYFLIFFGGSNSLSISIYAARVAAAADGSICAFPSFPYVYIRDPQKKEILCRRVRWEKNDRVSDDATTHKQITTTFLASAII